MGIKMIGITTIEVMMEDGSEVKEDKTNTITEIDRIVVAIKGTAMEVEVIGVIIKEIIGGKIIITRVIETSNLTSVEGLNKTNSIKINSTKVIDSQVQNTSDIVEPASTYETELVR